jgi:hypothetical protein
MRHSTARSSGSPTGLLLSGLLAGEAIAKLSALPAPRSSLSFSTAPICTVIPAISTATLNRPSQRLPRLSQPNTRAIGWPALSHPLFGPLTPEEDQAIIDRINDARPDVLWVALGLPKQDIWIHDRLSRLKVPVAVGVGAAFAFVAGTVPRCPEWIGRAGFEWVFRLLAEPKKLWRRDFFDGPLFLYQAGLELFRNEPSTDRRPIAPE